MFTGFTISAFKQNNQKKAVTHFIIPKITLKSQFYCVFRKMIIYSSLERVDTAILYLVARKI